jgi:hypothetical protein
MWMFAPAAKKKWYASGYMEAIHTNAYRIRDSLYLSMFMQSLSTCHAAHFITQRDHGTAGYFTDKTASESFPASFYQAM